ncbi:MAG: phosphoribosylglycinamide formyltransferase [Planctomycetia bacterium]|nr:phosphoribosylglycinamide formyltransferase [Planctomycetia bacterium]
MLNIVVLVSGNGSNLQTILNAIERKELTGVRVAGIISNNPHSVALERGCLAGVPVRFLSPKAFENRSDFHQKLLEMIDGFQPDLVVLAGFLVVLPESIVQKYEHRMINMHPSLIPSFCGKGYHGLKVHEAAIARGVKLAGATVHFVDCGTDTGPILAQKAVPVLPDDTPETLQNRVMRDAEQVLLPQVLQWIADGRVYFRDGNALVR